LESPPRLRREEPSDRVGRVRLGQIKTHEVSFQKASSKEGEAGHSSVNKVIQAGLETDQARDQAMEEAQKLQQVVSGLQDRIAASQLPLAPPPPAASTLGPSFPSYGIRGGGAAYSVTQSMPHYPFDAEGAYQHMQRQVQALNEAFGTISDVLMEEVDAVRAEMTSQRREVTNAAAAQGNEIRELKIKAETMGGVIGEVRKEIRRGAAEASEHNDNVHSEMRALALECRRANEVAAEAVRQNGVLSERLELMQKEQRRQLEASDEVQNASRKREIQLTSGFEQTKDLVERRGLEAAELAEKTEEKLTSLKVEHAEASSALAMDVGALAEEAAQVRQDHAAQMKALAGELQVCLTESQDNSQRQLGTLTEDMKSLNGDTEARLATELHQTGGLVERLEAELRAVQSQVRGLETALETQKGDLTALITQRGEDAARRMESMSHAVKVFADMAVIADPSAHA